MTEAWRDGYNEVTDETDEFGRPWDPANHVDPVDAQWRPAPDYADYVSPGGLSPDERRDVQAGGMVPGTRAYDIGGPQSGK